MSVLEITWRVGNGSLAFIAAVLLVWWYSDRWHRLPRHDRTIGFGVLLLVANGTVAAVEAAGTGIGLRTVIGTVALSCTVAGLVNARRAMQEQQL